ncbi:MAG TPA: helix-turn-helix domain-containing protein [Bryobacteraceae bacterium]|nr:helix-turn-helix domain-containing protein [Bryobacteraceae bacterium]
MERARIVLLAGTGLQDRQITAELKISRRVARWRKRFLNSLYSSEQNKTNG